jgi:hypothetical protein
MSRFQFHMPPELVDACHRRASPEEMFRVGAKYWKPTLVAMISQPPYSGAPVLGFSINASPAGDVHVVINGFHVCYYPADGEMVVEYMGFDDLVLLNVQRLNSYVQQGLDLANARPWTAEFPSGKYPPMLVFKSPPSSAEPSVDANP